MLVNNTTKTDVFVTQEGQVKRFSTTLKFFQPQLREILNILLYMISSNISLEKWSEKNTFNCRCVKGLEIDIHVSNNLSPCLEIQVT